MTAPASGARRLLFIVLPVVVIAAAVAVALMLIKTAPQARQAPPPPAATLVETTGLEFGRHPVVIEAMGTVVPARAIDLQPRVGGTVVEVAPAFEPGGRFAAGETLLRIDAADYELEVRRLRSALAKAEADLRVEQGNQSVARREFELLGEKLKPEDRDLVLRTPQLETVQAEVDAARAALDQAELDLQRTRVTAPFNALVQSRAANVGSHVSPSTTLARLVGTDAYWIEATVPVDQLRWLAIPTAPGQPGSAAAVYNPSAWGANASRAGRVLRLAGDLEEQGRMARIMVQVDDPLGLKSSAPTLLIGSYVRLELNGATLDNVARIDRRLLRDDDSLWLMDAEGRLVIRPVEVVFRSRDSVLVRDGIAPGERLVATDLATPVAGMALRTADAKPAQGQP